jgi:hypothetical protein
LHFANASWLIIDDVINTIESDIFIRLKEDLIVPHIRIQELFAT